LHDRIVFRTDENSFGMAHSSVQVGDEVVLVGGCDVPLVLRKECAGRRLVAAAYIHGVMQGQGRPDPDRLQDIVLVFQHFCEPGHR